MKTINKSSLPVALTALMIMFLLEQPAATQVSNNAVSISFKKPPVSRGMSDPFKNWWFQHSFPVGEYYIDVSASSPLPLQVGGSNRSSVFLEGKDATAVIVSIGVTAEICGEMINSNKYFCLPLKEVGKITKLDVFKKVREVKSKKERPTDLVTIWESSGFTGKYLDLGIGINNVSNLDFGYIASVWIPNGYWAMFCQELSDDRKLCGPGRGTQAYLYRNDREQMQTTRQTKRRFKYVLVGKGEPPPEPKSKLESLPKPDTKTLPKPKPKRLL